MRTIKSSVMAKARSQKIKNLLSTLDIEEQKMYSLLLTLVAVEKGLMTMKGIAETVDTVKNELAQNKD